MPFNLYLIVHNKIPITTSLALFLTTFLLGFCHPVMQLTSFGFHLLWFLKSVTLTPDYVICPVLNGILPF